MIGPLKLDPVRPGKVGVLWSQGLALRGGAIVGRRVAGSRRRGFACRWWTVWVVGLWLGLQARAALPVVHVYRLPSPGSRDAYDETVAAASLQGLINRSSPELYLLGHTNDRPRYWLDTLQRGPGWLAGRPVQLVSGLDRLVALAGSRLRGAVVWDPSVPASLNVATTVAGVEDAAVLSPELAARRLAGGRVRVIIDLRGRFTGAETGSAKNDAYRWAVREYLARGRCSSRVLCLFEDSRFARDPGVLGYALTRDWAVRNRAFVFDLSPWGDEPPRDEPDQRPGVDLETYGQILAETRRQAAGHHMTELNGFFVFSKYAHTPEHPSRHEPVPTEWETVHLISPYGVYQNTATSDCYNQSFHSHAPRIPLHQQRAVHSRELQHKTYLCFLMADYDSGSVLYDYLPRFWEDPGRGRIPLAWGINPNLLDTYPDLIRHFYATLSPNDTVTADAGAAGYINPSRIRESDLSLFVHHNKAYFREADLSIAPMVLDWVNPDPAVKDAFRRFAPDGYGSMVWDMHSNTGPRPELQVWKGMPVIELINDANEFPGVERTAEIVARAIRGRGGRVPGFYFFRIVWTRPTLVMEMLDQLRRTHPELDLEVLDVRTFLALYKRHWLEQPSPPRKDR